MPKKQSRTQKKTPKRHDLAAAVALGAILCVAVSIGQMMQGQIGSEAGGAVGNSSGKSSSRSAMPPNYSQQSKSSACNPLMTPGCEGNQSSRHSEDDEGDDDDDDDDDDPLPPISSVAVSSVQINLPPVSSATVIDIQQDGSDDDDDAEDAYEREMERQQYRSDRGCFDAAGNWVTDRSLCASVDRQAGFIDARQEPDSPPEIRVGERAAEERKDQETAFYEEMHLRFRGEELQAQQDELAARMTTAINHIEDARAGISDDVAAGRLADIASRIDALRVSLAGRVLAPSEREWAEEELRLLLDEGLAVIRQAWEGTPDAADDDRAELDAILAEFTFIVDASPAVFELSEQFGVDVPDASYVAYVRLRSMLEQAAAECVNARCPLLPQMVEILETELQQPLVQAMEQAMEPQEVSALIERIGQLMADRRAGL